MTPKAPKKRSFSETSAGFFVGISGSYTLYLIYLNDLPKAMIAGGITASFSLLMSFSEGLIPTLKQRMRQRGEATAIGIDEVFSTLFLTFGKTDILRRYLECQSLECQDYVSSGLNLNSGIFIPLLEEVFVPLLLDSSRAKYSQSINTSSTQEKLTIWDFLAGADQSTFRKIAILSSPGYGKSTLLSHVTYIYATGQHNKFLKRAPRRIPFLLTLRKFSGLLFDDVRSIDLLDLIISHHIPNLPKGAKLNVPRAWLEKILESGQAIVMLDGFDEIYAEHRRAVSHWIDLQFYNYPRTTFILTSRPEAYQRDFVRSSFTTSLFIRAFDIVQQEQFIRRWYLAQERYAHAGMLNSGVVDRANLYAENLIAQIHNNDRFSSIATNPVLLTMMASAHRNLGDSLPRQKADLYKRIVDVQLNGRPSSKGIHQPCSPGSSQLFLQHIALAMTIECITTISEDNLLDRLNKSFKHLDLDIQPLEFIRYIVQVSGILVRQAAEGYQFAHLSFQKYLAAVEIYRTKNEDFLLDNSKNIFWQDVISFYVEKLGDSRNFIRKLLDPIANPYVVGSPVKGDLFVGREDILRRFKELWSTSGQISSIVLYGHRRMGKTSILRNLSENIKQDLVIDFNMQRVGYVNSTGELLYNLALAIFHAVCKTQKLNIDEPSEADFLTKNPITNFDQFLSIVNPILNGQRIIITIDEFEIIEDLIKQKTIDSKLLDFLRSLIQTYSWFVLVFAGLHTLNEMIHDYWNPLFGSVQVIPVSFLSRKATEILITNPSNNFDLDYTPEAVSLIYELTYGQPYLTQLICHNLVTFFNRERFEKGIYREPPLTSADVEQVVSIPEFYRDGNAYFTGIWEQAKEVDGREQLEILNALSSRTLSEAELAQQTAMSPSQVHKAIETLKKHDVIYKDGELYSYRVELMRRWVARQSASLN